MGEDLGNLADLLGENAIPIGFIAYIKALDAEGNVFFALRWRDLNPMEALGLATVMADELRADLAADTYAVEDDE